MSRSAHGIDPMWSVLHEGGPWHSRVDVEWYLERLRVHRTGPVGRPVRGPRPGWAGGPPFPSDLDPTM